MPSRASATRRSRSTPHSEAGTRFASSLTSSMTRKRSSSGMLATLSASTRGCGSGCTRTSPGSLLAAP